MGNYLQRGGEFGIGHRDSEYHGQRHGGPTRVNLTLAGQVITGSSGSFLLLVFGESGDGNGADRGGTVAITVIAPDGCPWVVGNPYPSVVSFPSGSAGSGGGTVIASVGPASTAGPRNLGLPVGNTRFGIFQAGLCSYSLSNVPAWPSRAAGRCWCLQHERRRGASAGPR